MSQVYDRDWIQQNKENAPKNMLWFFRNTKCPNYMENQSKLGWRHSRKCLHCCHSVENGNGDGLKCYLVVTYIRYNE